jgi:hypothetical protein
MNNVDAESLMTKKTNKIIPLFFLFLLSLSIVSADVTFFTDTFNRGTFNTTVGNGWIDVTGDGWRIQNNDLMASKNGYNTILLNRPQSWNFSNITMTMTVNGTLNAAQSPLIWLRLSNTSNTSFSGYVTWAGYNGGLIQYNLGRVSNGVLTVINSINQVNGTGSLFNPPIKFVFSAIGNNITSTMYNNSNNAILARFSTIDTTFTDGYMGLSSNIQSDSNNATMQVWNVTLLSNTSAVSLTYPFDENVVKQRDPITLRGNLPVVGTGTPGSNITIVLNGTTQNAIVNSTGQFSTTFTNLATGCYAVTASEYISGIEISNFGRNSYCVGEVFFGYGQSNSAWSIVDWNYSRANYNLTSPYPVSAALRWSETSHSYLSNWANMSNNDTWYHMNFAPIAYGIGNKYNTPVMYVSAGVWAMPITNFTNGTASPIYNYTLSMVRNVTFDNTFRAGTWMQGESDYALTTQAYYNNLTALRNSYYTIWNEIYSPLIMIPVGPYSDASGEPCIAYQSAKTPVIANYFQERNNPTLFTIGTQLYDIAILNATSSYCAHPSYMVNPSNTSIREAAYAYGVRNFEMIDNLVFGVPSTRPTILYAYKFNATQVNVVWDRSIAFRSYSNASSRGVYGLDLYNQDITLSTSLANLIPAVNQSRVTNVSMSGNVVSILYNVPVTPYNFTAYALFPSSTYNYSVVANANTAYPFGLAEQTLTFELMSLDKYNCVSRGFSWNGNSCNTTTAVSATNCLINNVLITLLIVAAMFFITVVLFNNFSVIAVATYIVALVLLSVAWQTLTTVGTGLFC